MRDERIKLLGLALTGATPPACYDVPRLRGARVQHAGDVWRLLDVHVSERACTLSINSKGLELGLDSRL